MGVNVPEPDLHSVMQQLESAAEQLPDVPDWLLQGLAVWAAGKGIEWTWKHRKRITQAFRGPRHIERTVTDQLGLTDNVQPVLLSGSVGARATAHGVLTVGSPSLAKRLTDEGLELVSWYLRQR